MAMQEMSRGERMSEDLTTAQWAKVVMISIAINILLAGLVIGILIG
jgi:hypothetical protein